MQEVELFPDPCAQLLHQQCWQWGHDIRSPYGNLLLDYGFQRHRPPLGQMGSTRYQMRLSARSTMTLWGFGFYYARCGKGGAYVNRYECRPCFCALAGFLDGVWTKDQLPVSSDRNPDLRLLRYLSAKAFEWISAYEEWVLRTYGLAYRRETLREWHEPSILPEWVPFQWADLSRQLRTGSSVDAREGCARRAAS